MTTAPTPTTTQTKPVTAKAVLPPEVYRAMIRALARAIRKQK